MGLSGYEAMIVCSLSPMFLGISPVRSLVVQNLRIVHFLSLAGLMAFLIHAPDKRLFAVGAGVSMSCLAWTGTFYAERSQPHRLEARISAFSLGLLASSVAKFAFQTNNPIWPIMHGANGGWNKTGLDIALLAILR